MASPIEADDALGAAGVQAVARRWPAKTLGLYLSERKLLLGAVDLLCINAALVIATSWRFGNPLWQAWALQRSWYVVLSAVWIGTAFLMGSYDLRRAAKLGAGAANGAATALVTAAVYLLIPYVTPPLPTSRLSLVVFLVAMVVAVMAWRATYALTLVRPGLRRKALVIGAGWAGREIAEAIRQHAATEYELAGFVDDDPKKGGTPVDGLPVLGTGEDLNRLIRQTGASEIIVAITQPDRMHSGMFQVIMDCHERGIQVTQMQALFEQLTRRVPVEHAGRNLYIVLPLNGYTSRVQRSVKRLIDLVIGIIGFALTVLVLPFVWLAIRLEGKGNVFYRQARVGQSGRLFNLIKFRTMVPEAEVNGPKWAEERDPRITRVGRLLRRLHIDEIPQAINILRGDLSFIGPRPERPEFVAQLERQIPFYRARHAVRPGVTGWAQVNFQYGASVGDALVKLQYDLYYIKHQSLWLDLVILSRTIATVLSLRGR